MKKIIKYFKNILNIIINYKHISILIIFIFAILSALPGLLGNHHFGDDFWFHYASIKTYADHLPFSILYKVFPDISYNFGFGMGFFYPALPHIIGAIIYKIVSIFGHGLLATSAILHLLTFFFIGLSMYALASKIFSDKKKGLVASLFYMTYNYVYVDIIFREAMNEAFIFIFIPLVFLGIWYLLKEHNKKMFYIFFSIGYIGLIYSHLVMTVWFTLFLVPFLLLFAKEILKKENLISFVIASLIILIFTSTFTIPMIEHKMFGNYVAFAEDRTMTMENIWYMPLQGFLKIYKYTTCTPGGYLYANFNYIVITFSVLALYRLFTKKIPKERRNFMIGLLIFGFLGLFFNTFIRIWLYVPKILLSIQFVWRLSSFVGFAVCLFATEGLDSYLELFKKKYIKFALMIIIVFLMIFTKRNLDMTSINIPNISSNFNYYNITREHYPLKAYTNRNYFKERNHDVLVVDGEATVKVLSNKVPQMKFNVTNLKKEATLELPRFYYLGYEVEDSKGNIIPYSESEYGFIELNIKENGVYKLRYTGTKGYKISMIIKVLLILVFIFLFIKRNIVSRRSSK